MQVLAHTKYNEMIRLSAVAKPTADDMQQYYIDKIFEEQPYLGNVYPNDTRKIGIIFEIKNAVIEYFNLGISGSLNGTHRKQLERCYASCLETAVQNSVRSIAFCCISTGVFGFPQKEAAEIAVRTVRKFQKGHNIEVVFNVFTENDYEIYSRLLG